MRQPWGDSQKGSEPVYAFFAVETLRLEREKCPVSAMTNPLWHRFRTWTERRGWNLWGPTLRSCKAHEVHLKREHEHTGRVIAQGDQLFFEELVECLFIGRERRDCGGAKVHKSHTVYQRLSSVDSEFDVIRVSRIFG